jgi:hypothetical protein
MSIYYNPQLLRLLHDDRIQEVMRGRTARRISDRPIRVARRPEAGFSDEALVRGSSRCAGC